MQPRQVPPEVLLVEYGKAQDSAQHHDTIVWSVISITWAAELVLLGFVVSSLGNIRLRIIITALCFLGAFMVAFQWYVQKLSRTVRKQKYDRCKEIEEQLGMSQNRSLKYPAGIQTRLLQMVCLLFLIAWATVFWTIWWG